MASPPAASVRRGCRQLGYRQTVMPSTSTQLPEPPDCLAGLGDGAWDGCGDEPDVGAEVDTGAGDPDAWGAGGDAPPPDEVVVVFPGFGAVPGCPGEEPFPGCPPGSDPWP